MEELKNPAARVVGARETVKKLAQGRVRLVYIARDADPKVVDPVLQACQARQVPVVWVDAMAELGRLCGIAVGAACAAGLGPPAAP
ncbi:Putative ribosomal protein L7Ae-like [Candidatus Hydrogenisulfobacillus filiaventi]|uniref:Ribosomal protein L7Ae-like n=1 Tax=Candidatus Hydrogenisulfobacillus filiaventi TaxID=2707344 RepID=A0A6F8ZJW0_9FIRM|nr:Putative ribosomal protein L7Ae-like [Candidatus Hydrogenisulfobacillus filiaventi]